MSSKLARNDSRVLEPAVHLETRSRLRVPSRATICTSYQAPRHPQVIATSEATDIGNMDGPRPDGELASESHAIIGAVFEYAPC
jgi:hypothetical protein